MVVVKLAGFYCKLLSSSLSVHRIIEFIEARLSVLCVGFANVSVFGLRDFDLRTPWAQLPRFSRPLRSSSDLSNVLDIASAHDSGYSNQVRSMHPKI